MKEFTPTPNLNTNKTEAKESQKYEPNILPIKTIDMNSESFDAYDSSLKKTDEIEYNKIYKIDIGNETIGKNRFKYFLFKNIAGLTYVFYMQKTQDNDYSFGYRTEEFEYALTSLDTESKDILFHSIADFFESIYKDLKSVEGFRITYSPSEFELSSKDIDRCMNEIINWFEAHPDEVQKYVDYHKDLREFLLARNIYDIMELYREIFGKKFERDKIATDKLTSIRRKNYFIRQWQKYSNNWKYEDVPMLLSEGQLVRK
jgi:hypothetical protein